MPFGGGAQRFHVGVGQAGELVAEPPDAFGQLPAGRAGGPDRVVEVVEHGRHPVEQGTPGGREGDVLGGAAQQHAAQAALEGWGLLLL
ncbi:hypothetical protein [Nonomuraea sp. GTA35]|uniref:hypothetical protein n=1 Tax=Nonomuraea sp. GTA35 TaxID=1676746 RepID=UPI0035BF40F0